MLNARFAFLCLLLIAVSVDRAPEPTDAPCKFDRFSEHYSGSAAEQAKCLLRPVGIYAHLGAELGVLPAPFSSLLGRPVLLSRTAFRQYLKNNHISEAEVGGDIENTVSQTKRGNLAQYFVIHDTSTRLTGDQFPSDVNQGTWSFNSVSKWTDNGLTHVFITRIGTSVGVGDLKLARYSTKFENLGAGRLAGLFLHVELVQPRIRDPKSQNPHNDAVAPSPGFTQLQHDRLALVYVAASVRRGLWLIPAYHAVIDAGIPNGHDDPQKFDVELWAARVRTLLEALHVSYVTEDSPENEASSY